MKTCEKCHKKLKDKETCHCKVRIIRQPLDEKGFPLYVKLPTGQLVRAVPKKKINKHHRRKLNAGNKASKTRQ
jgi:hypothetical protein